MKATRSYVMTTRAEAVAQTRARILRACISLATRGPLAGISLADVAADANVSVQTVLRQFGSRDDLIDAAAELVNREVADERSAVEDDVPAAMALLLDHYEARGDTVIMMLGQESTDPRVARITANGKAMHRTWVEDVFAHLIGDIKGSLREEMIDMLVVATDVYTWKLLRRDRGLSRDVVEKRMTRLAEAVAGGERHG